MCGLPGAGKTTVAKQIEVARGAVRLCPDEWIYPLLEDHSDQIEMDRLRHHIEDLHWTLAQRLLSLGVSVILENGFWVRSERAAFRKQAEALGARVELHYEDAPRDELLRRIVQRNQNLGSGSFHVNAEQLDLWFDWFEAPTPEELGEFAQPGDEQD